MIKTLPIPSFFKPDKVGEVWRVPYSDRASQAQTWAVEHSITSAATDKTRVCLLLIDVQNTFCIPGFELFVGGKSGNGAVEDNIRLCEFIYRNLGAITEIIPTMDTHSATQIFHPVFWLNSLGFHPQPATTITYEEVKQGLWRVNPAIAFGLKMDYASLQDYALYYVKTLELNGKYPLTVWAYHSMLGGIGHALVSAIEEAIFFHNIARNTQSEFILKGDHPLTENYSVIQPEVSHDAQGKTLVPTNTALLKKIREFDAIVIAGQAKSHCVAWTVADLLRQMEVIDPQMAEKVYLLEDCTSAVVVEGVIDFTEQAEKTFAGFAEARMHLVNSSQLKI